MRIGLLTYHHVTNPGSVLQTFCGYRLLQLAYPKARIEIIDYYPEDSQKFNASMIRHSPKRKILQEESCQFLERNCHFSAGSIGVDDIATASKAINAFDYDLIVVGSDTVFQVDGYLGRYIAGPKAPNLYYLPKTCDLTKLGFAVSFDPPQPIDEEMRQMLGGHLRDFSFILYRDEHAESSLRELGLDEEKIAYMPDPTIMCDFATAVPHESGFSECVPENAVGISISDPDIRSNSISWVEKQGFTPVDMMNLDGLSRAVKQRTFLRIRRQQSSFLERIAIYRDLAGLITDRFHGSIFSLRLGDYPVVGIESSSTYPQQRGKLTDLYRRLGIESSLIRCGKDTKLDAAITCAWSESKKSVCDRQVAFAALRVQGYEGLRKAMKIITNSN